jgi:glycosyltransferase involved in cell wall biosynthesis
MRVWLLHIGEDLPVDGTARRYRYSYLADALVNAGHQVLRWAPTFRHNTKSHRFSTDARIELNENYAVQFVHSPAYRRNIGFDRLRTYRVLDRRFRQLASREPKPDLIVAAIPSLEWAEAAVDYAQAQAIPVVIDVRDLWPDVFVNGLPSLARPFGRLLFTPYYSSARRSCRGAAALTAVSQTYLDWALNLAGRSRRPSDLVVPLGFQPQSIPETTLQKNVATLRKLGIDAQRPVCLFVGLLERSYDLETVIDAARHLELDGNCGLQFVVCGDGSKMSALKRQAGGLRSVHLIGWVDAAMLEAAASISKVGLCAYTADALQSLPNKPFEYMAHRLAVVSSLPGEMATLLSRHGSGLTYRAGDALSLSGCLRSLVADPLRLEAMRSRAYETWLHNFRSCDVYAAFVEHLALLAAHSGRASQTKPPFQQAA